jgi:hypothetical protein
VTSLVFVSELPRLGELPNILSLPASWESPKSGRLDSVRNDKDHCLPNSHTFGLRGVMLRLDVNV